MNLTEILSLRLHKRDLERLAATADIEAVYELIFSENKRIAYNALWVLTHLPAEYDQWLATKRSALIDMLLSEHHEGKKRNLFNLLNRLPLDEADVRTDYLDFCFAKINSLEPYAVRSFAIKQAYAQARHFPELLSELRGELNLLDAQTLAPGLRSTLRQIKRKLDKKP